MFCALIILVVKFLVCAQSSLFDFAGLGLVVNNCVVVIGKLVVTYSSILLCKSLKVTRVEIIICNSSHF